MGLTSEGAQKAVVPQICNVNRGLLSVKEVTNSRNRAELYLTKTKATLKTSEVASARLRKKQVECTNYQCVCEEEGFLVAGHTDTHSNRTRPEAVNSLPFGPGHLKPLNQ